MSLTVFAIACWRRPSMRGLLLVGLCKRSAQSASATASATLEVCGTAPSPGAAVAERGRPTRRNPPAHGGAPQLRAERGRTEALCSKQMLAAQNKLVATRGRLQAAIAASKAKPAASPPKSGRVASSTTEETTKASAPDCRRPRARHLGRPKRPFPQARPCRSTWTRSQVLQRSSRPRRRSSWTPRRSAPCRLCTGGLSQARSEQTPPGRC